MAVRSIGDGNAAPEALQEENAQEESAKEGVPPTSKADACTCHICPLHTHRQDNEGDARLHLQASATTDRAGNTSQRMQESQHTRQSSPMPVQNLCVELQPEESLYITAMAQEASMKKIPE